MNKIANSLFGSDIELKAHIKKLAKTQFTRRKIDYSAKAIFEAEDLEQAIWCALFESNCHDADSLKKKAFDFSENLARAGTYKRNNTVEVPISQLPEGQRQAIANIFYSSAHEMSE